MTLPNDVIEEIWGTVSQKDWESWHWQFSHRLSDVTRLPRRIWQNEDAETIAGVVKHYPFLVTPYYLSLCGNAAPVMAQCIPRKEELDNHDSLSPDPLQEERFMPVAGLIHRYDDRCLILTNHICAVHCRHCNRKRFWARQTTASLTENRLKQMIDYIGRQKGIREVILSGGDPLAMPDGKLDALLGALRSISHVEILRIGTRMPVVMPMRITKSLCRILKRHRPLWLNTQFNHHAEITADAAKACEMVLASGVPISNQSVLLKKVNDSFTVMRDLVYGLQRIGVRPYYLFQCEPVLGAGHFQVDIQQGKHIMEEIWRKCSGLCQPAYILDSVHGKEKIPFPHNSPLPCYETSCY
ncbi:MAG: KamA family radical SAM protein [Syntrophobacterales bacterium]|jgi:lysine 2,3-aminomutase|nr:KamA family radical SAM protein [Syntrophobacterales bacterium]